MSANHDQVETMRLPDFIGIGTQKGGTTTLHHMLSRQNDVYLPRQKELQFFSSKQEKSVEWYSDQFENARANQTCGEITPYYMFHKDCPRRIGKLIPTIKLIALVRNPIERTLSQYFHAKRLGFEDLDLMPALEAEKARMMSGGEYSYQKHSYVSRSKYNEQLLRFEKYFPKEQLLIIKSEDLFSNSNSTFRKVLDFLEVKKQTAEVTNIRENTGEKEAVEVDPAIRSWLEQELRADAEQMNRYGITWDWI